MRRSVLFARSQGQRLSETRPCSSREEARGKRADHGHGKRIHHLRVLGAFWDYCCPGSSLGREASTKHQAPSRIEGGKRKCVSESMKLPSLSHSTVLVQIVALPSAGPPITGLGVSVRVEDILGYAQRLARANQAMYQVQ